jgi:hypothetical protein
MASLREPRALVRFNGSVVAGCESFTVANNSFYEADTYHLVLSASKLPLTNNAIWLAEQTETFVEILAGFPSTPDKPSPNELTSFIYGRIDDMDFDPVSQTITLTGRDLTGAFIDAKIAQDYANQTSSQIATQLAGKHGLATKITKTSTPVGNYFEQATMELQANLSEWDLLSRLAREEGFVVLIQGQTLYFGPDQTGTGNPLVLNYVAPTVLGGPPSGNFEELSFSRSQTVVKGVTVTVQSAGRYNPTIKKSYPTAPRGISPGKSSPYGATTDYFYNMPAGATAIQVEQRAQAIYSQIISHAMKLKCRMPADVTTTPQSTIRVKGTGTAFDQTYFPKKVTRSLSTSEGFVMDIEAQNTSPNLTP